MKYRNISLMFLLGLIRGEVYRIFLVLVDFYLILFFRICVFNIWFWEVSESFVSILYLWFL